MSNSLGYLSFHNDLKFLDQVLFYGFSTSNSAIQGFEVIEDKGIKFIIVNKNGVFSQHSLFNTNN